MKLAKQNPNIIEEIRGYKQSCIKEIKETQITFMDIWVLFGQLDLFILQWEEVLCDGFDLTMLDPGDRKGNNTHVSLLLRIKRWDLYLKQ